MSDKDKVQSDWGTVSNSFAGVLEPIEHPRVVVSDRSVFDLAEHIDRPTVPAPEPEPLAPANAREVAEAMQLYLSSNVAMLLFSKLTLYRAVGENPKVVVKYAGLKFRVHIERSNGQKEHFNRDGKE